MHRTCLVVRPITSTVRILVMVATWSCTLSAWAQDRENVVLVPVEHITKKPQKDDGALGTTFYAPSEKEKPFFEKLVPSEQVTGGLAGDYDISKKDKTFVGWFGIVRQVDVRERDNQTTLLVEHKYFDGFTDTHIQALSFNGSGDFTVVLSGIGYEIEPLSLVKVYGGASILNADSKPVVNAEFVRNWHWGTFTFILASGEQRGSEEWRKLNSVDLDDIYDPYPDDEYYKQRLGKR